MLIKYLNVSRPRFWVYLLGPFLIGAVSADASGLIWAALAVFAFYFTYPANLLIYGVNDIFDYETDKHNPKKVDYEGLVTPDKRKGLAWAILLWNVPFALVWFFDTLPGSFKIAYAGFLLFGIFYSAPPIRAKTKPIIDSVFNTLYIFPGLLAYALLKETLPPLQLIIAATLWCMAMHAFSAIPDIKADRQANIHTVATFLRARGTLLYCALCYGGAAYLSYSALNWFSLGAGALYVLLMCIPMFSKKPGEVFGIYKLFPYINMSVGAALFFYIALLVK